MKLFKKIYSNYLIYNINKSLDFPEGYEVVVFTSNLIGERCASLSWRKENSATIGIRDCNDAISKRIKYINKLRELEE